MKKLRFIIAIFILSLSFIAINTVKADGNDEAYTKSVYSLNKQLYTEIRDVLNLPVYLAFEDKNLKGDATVTMKVNKGGKLVIASIYGQNEILKRYLVNKINSRNIWTPQKYSEQYFRFKIQVK